MSLLTGTGIFTDTALLFCFSQVTYIEDSSLAEKAVYVDDSLKMSDGTFSRLILP